ncbi:MAG: protoheme IX farnesyltransferase [Alphaproteobacteria bacterium]|nr:protoheme IX farnesyltransferase [Alphaproteobacteria bacterium]
MFASARSSDAPEAFDDTQPRVVDYLALLKPRVMSLVVFTGVVGLVAAPGSINPVLAVLAILCIAVGAGASGALNMWYDADIDARMKRTRGRPIPAGRLTDGDALALGIGLSVGSVVVLGLFINVLSAALLAFTIAFYVVVYTMWLKRRTAQNIVIGGAAGALPPVIGWAVVTGSVTWQPLLLFAIIFMWTPPHFWALSLFAKNDDEKVGVPMLPVVAGLRETRKQILIYSLLLVPLAVSPSVLGMAGLLYGAVSVILGAVFLGLAWRVWRGDDLVQPRRLFLFSILYLFALYAALLVEKVVGLS